MKVTESYQKFSFIRFYQPILRSDTTKNFYYEKTDMQLISEREAALFAWL